MDFISIYVGGYEIDPVIENSPGSKRSENYNFKQTLL